jgi:tungstate transport system substrate-binding protein
MGQRHILVATGIKRIIFVGATLALAGLAGCGRPAADNTSDNSAEIVAPPSGGQVLRLATTTSTRDSGLLDVLLPVFERASGCRVDVVAVGTGAALQLGEAGDADVVLVHARQAEEAFVQAGHGVRHEEFMFNDFVLLGPEQDPAQIRGADPAAALAKIAAAGAVFLSRGDDSGTHKREMGLWAEAGLQPDWDGYLEVGQGMGPTLIMADEKQGYVLADRGTYLHFRDKVQLVPLSGPAAGLRNPYAVITVNPEKHQKINAPLAEAFVDFLISGPAQQLIADYRVAGQPL